ncbi:hypothetical protein NQ315_009395 [Exocentrus adspersus]|uniref:Indole-3-acetaldehyde oxidase n=1 Tax=Exocentrus adspersus TaxID=1586481 RepID=A0AAV8WFN2_9CUCU|nr:hypothetical protein NQ315_009395 [Exocentrus adspersus]
MDKLSKLKFRISDKEYSVNAEDVSPETTLNKYLRDHLHLTGTKRLCMEGGCGSCIVAVEDTVGDTKRIYAVNSCLVSIYSVHGKTIHTVEGIGNPVKGFHPIQKLLADNNGTQCGFCSPGMVMNMYALNESGPKTEQEIEDSFSGNICRCTGYRPILYAFRKLAVDSKEFIDIEDLKPCKRDKCINDCKGKCSKKSYEIKEDPFRWIKVYKLSEVLLLLKAIGTNNYMLVAGNTAKGVYRSTTTPDLYIDVSEVTELTTYSATSTKLSVGGNFTLNNAINVFKEVAAGNANFAYLSTIAKHISLVANVPVRNIGTIAGNLMMKYNNNDFPSDIFLLLETFNASIVIVDIQANEESVSPADFLNLDMTKKVIKQIVFTALDSDYKYESYKIMNRAQNTHALVNAGFLVQLNYQTVVSARIVYGNINPTFIHASNLETFLRGRILFDNSVLSRAFQVLDIEINPDYVLPEPTPEFRKLLAISLFYKFVLSITPEDLVSSRNKSGGSLIQRPLSKGSQEFGTIPDNYPVGEPVVKVEALAQCSGQAEYIADIADRPSQLFGALVTAKAVANSQILSVDASKALALEGVVAYFGKDDVPGENTFTPSSSGFPLAEELFCSGRVQYYDQTIGIIVAEDQGLAMRAANLVEVQYSAPSQKPYLNIKQVLDANDTSRIRVLTNVVAEKKGTDVTHVIKGNFYVGHQYHFHMETQCCNVVPTEDGLDIHPSTQWMDLIQQSCSAALNIPTNKINISVRRLGGGFGAKIMRNSLVSTAATLAAYKLNQPVKISLSLEMNIAVIGKRYPLYTTYEVGVNDKGVIQYLECDLYTDIGVGGNETPGYVIVDLFKNCYDYSTWTFTTHSVATDTHANCSTRAPGSLEGTAAIEHIMEHIAHEINVDAADVKAANMDKVKFAKVGEIFDQLHTWAEIASRKQEIETFNKENRWKKRGISLIPLAWPLNLPINYSALVSVFHGDGGIAISHGGIEMGQGVNTKATQACAQRLGVPMEMVSVKPSYNVVVANSMVSGGSITSEAICFAVLRACDTLLERLEPIKERLGGNPAWKELINAAYAANVQLIATGFFAPTEPGFPSYIVYGAGASEVEVDILTGQSQILRYDMIEDTGESINPLVDIGQVEGAVAMGLGYFTMEQIISNEEGRILTNRTWNYTPPQAKDIPVDLRIKFPENNPNPNGVLRSKAVAEPPICVTCSIPLAIRDAMASARAEADPDKPKFYPFDGPSTVENTLLNSLNSYDQLSEIKFKISDTEYTVQVGAVTPETTLNKYLRDYLHLTGTKKLCLEGGCGTCIVAVEETVGDTKRVFAVNSCLVSIYSVHGWTIHTIESIGNPVIGYHPLQKLLADNNGSQCGFCSAGMIMNMYALKESGPKTAQEIEDGFSGNICRCTGYRPILHAFRQLAADAGDIEDLKPCKKGTCFNDCKDKCDKNKSFKIVDQLFRWIKVYKLSEVLLILRTMQAKTYMLVAGNTAKGVYRPVTLPDLYIDVSDVKELTSYSVTSTAVTLGGNFALKDTIDVFKETAAGNANFAYLATMAKHIALVANIPVRNIGTIAGNLMIKYNHNEFPSDIFLLLETFDATLVIVDTQGREVRVSPKDFLSLDMNRRVIKQVVLKPLDSNYKYETYKIMARSQNTHALVNAGFLLKLNYQTVVSARIVYGHINPKFVHASSLESFLPGKVLFNNKVLRQSFQVLDAELNPDHVLPDPTPEFRKLLAISLFYKFVLKTAPQNLVSIRNRSGGSLLIRPLSTALQEFGTNPAKYPVTEPIIKVEALAQCSGQAEYIPDIPDRPYQLFGALVTAKAPANSQIISVDTSRALAIKGVVAYFGKDDVPGQNVFIPAAMGLPVSEELFCSGRVLYYDQTIGIIVAVTQELAIDAAKLVEVAYSAPTQKPYLNVKEVVAANDTTRITAVTTVIAERRGTDVTHVIKGKFYIGMQYHFHMEAQCCSVVPTEDGIDLYPSTQWMDLNQQACAAALNISTNNTQIRGGFGAKIMRNSLVSTAAAVAAHILHKPVKIWLPMETNMTVLGKRIPLYTEYEVGVNDQGVIQYLETDLYSDMGVGGNEDVDPYLIDMFENCYDFSTWTFTTHTVATDTHANCWTRAPGSLEGTAAIEHIMEQIAYTVKLDTAAVKAANMDRVSHPLVGQLWDEMQTWADIPNRKQEIATYNAANRWKKRGISIVPMAWTLDFEVNYSILVSIYHGDGGVVISHGGIEMGQGINTKAIQACAHKFGIPIDIVSVKPSYNVIAPNSYASGGSITSEGVCYGVLNACDVLLERLAPIKESLGGNPTWEELINAAFLANIQLTASGFFAPSQPNYPIYVVYGVCASEVEVDILTGQNQILRYDVLEDVGESISPLIDIGQVEGAVVMGIGYYTTENIVQNEEGEILTNRTWYYTPPQAKDIPINFRVKFPENNPNPKGVLGSKAIAEPPICLTCSIPLAIRNAVASARAEADPSQPLFYPIDGPSTVENTLLNTLNTYEQYVL